SSDGPGSRRGEGKAHGRAVGTGGAGSRAVQIKPEASEGTCVCVWGQRGFRCLQCAELRERRDITRACDGSVSRANYNPTSDSTFAQRPLQKHHNSAQQERRATLGGTPCHYAIGSRYVATVVAEAS